MTRVIESKLLIHSINDLMVYAPFLEELDLS